LWNGQIGADRGQDPARFSALVVVAYDPLPRCGLAIREVHHYVDPITLSSLVM